MVFISLVSVLRLLEVYLGAHMCVCIEQQLCTDNPRCILLCGIASALRTSVASHLVGTEHIADELITLGQPNNRNPCHIC